MPENKRCTDSRPQDKEGLLEVKEPMYQGCWLIARVGSRIWLLNHSLDTPDTRATKPKLGSLRLRMQAPPPRPPKHTKTTPDLEPASPERNKLVQESQSGQIPSCRRLERYTVRPPPLTRW